MGSHESERLLGLIYPLLHPLAGVNNVFVQNSNRTMFYHVMLGLFRSKTTLRNSVLRTTESILKNIQPDTELLLNIDVDR